MAEHIVAVEVENRYFIELLRPNQQDKGKLYLTTVEKGQRIALVNVYVKKGRKSFPLHTFRIDPVPISEERKPNIDLVAEKRGADAIVLTLFVENNVYARETVKITKPFYKRGWIWVAAAGIGILLVLLFVLREPFIRGATSHLVQNTSPSSSLKESEPKPQREQTSNRIASEQQREQLPSKSASEQPRTHSEKGTASEQSAPSATIEEESVSSNNRHGTGSPSETEEIDEKARNGKEGSASNAGAKTGTNAADTEEAPADETAQLPSKKEWTVYFLPDSNELTEEAQSMLQEVAEMLKEHPGVTVTIAGHCALYGTESGRLALSQERAQNVYRYLRTLTWKPEKRPDIEWYGAKEFITDDREMQQLNRRVEIEVAY